MAESRIFRPVARPLGSDGLPRTEPERVVETRGLWTNGTGELLTFFYKLTSKHSLT